jgi:PAS domain S-box-containing protein
MGNTTEIKRKTLNIGILFLFVLIIFSSSFLYWIFLEKEKDVENSSQKRLHILAESKIELIETWLSGVIQQGDRIIQSELFRLYATEVDLIDKDISHLLIKKENSSPKEIEHLSAQLPMMQNSLREFVAYADFLTGKIVNRQGQAYIASDSSFIPLSEIQREVSLRAISSGKPAYSSLHQSSQGLVLDIALPIHPPQNEEQQGNAVASLLLTRSVNSALSQFLASSPLAGKGHQTHIVQVRNGTFLDVLPWLPEGMREIAATQLRPESGTLTFGVRSGISGKGRVYSLGVGIPDLNWLLVEELDYDLTRSSLTSFKRSATTMLGLTLLLLGAAFMAFWWRFSYVESERIKARFLELNTELEKQRSLLTGITETAQDFIALKDTFGHYRYVNSAMAAALGREPQEIIGMDDVALFGYDTGNRLEEGDKQAYAGMRAARSVEKIFLQSTPHTFQISKIPYVPAGQPEGIVSIYRDISDLIQAQEQHERAIRKTVEALVRTIEANDPYLAGHSRLLRGFALEIGKHLGISDEQQATMEMAANLSQIGKQFIDRDILNKSGELSPEERKIVESHVQHAERILCSVDFRLPILNTVSQMNENLDGSGYPKGLRGDEIPLPARILSVSNAFCAMVRPRSYRPAKEVDHALSILKGLKQVYDQNVVEALEKILPSREGIRLLAEETDTRFCEM